jgi:hypothetical protein
VTLFDFLSCCIDNQPTLEIRAIDTGSGQWQVEQR